MQFSSSVPLMPAEATDRTGLLLCRGQQHSPVLGPAGRRAAVVSLGGRKAASLAATFSAWAGYVRLSGGVSPGVLTKDRGVSGSASRRHPSRPPAPACRDFTAVGGHWDLPACGHEICPETAIPITECDVRMELWLLVIRRSVPQRLPIGR